MKKNFAVTFVSLTSVYTTGYRHATLVYVVFLFNHHVTLCLLKFHQTFPPINSCNIMKLDEYSKHYSPSMAIILKGDLLA